MFNETDYRHIISEKLAERSRSNPGYSLRAMARDLEISASRLSQVLQGKQGVSDQVARTFAKRLGFSAAETEFFCTLVESTDARSKMQRKLAQIKLSQKYFAEDSVRRMEADVFKTIADWYHFAILELTTIRGFKSDVSWIAQRLGISTEEVSAAVERLKRLGLLKLKGKTLVQTHNSLATHGEVPSEAIRKYHHQILERATKSIHSQSIDERDLSALTVSIRSQDLPKFKRQIANFRRSFNESAEAHEKNKKPDEVYCLSLQFFKLSQGEQA